MTTVEITEALKHREIVRAICGGLLPGHLWPAIIAGLVSRESAWGLTLKPKGPGGTGDFQPRNNKMPPDGLGWGRGLMQIDYKWHEFARTGNWQDPKENMAFGCEILATNLDSLTKLGLPSDGLLRAVLAAYNSGLGNVKKALRKGLPVDYYTADGPDADKLGDYSEDVLIRAKLFTQNQW